MEVDLCGWTLPESRDRVTVEITTASLGPGPSVDAAPGSSEGEQLCTTTHCHWLWSRCTGGVCALFCDYSPPAAQCAVFIAVGPLRGVCGGKQVCVILQCGNEVAGGGEGRLRCKGGVCKQSGVKIPFNN